MTPIRIFADTDTTKTVFDYLETYGFEKHAAVSPISEISQVSAPIRICVRGNELEVLPDWFNTTLPVLLPTGLPFDTKSLVSLVMYFSGLTEDALNLSAGTPVNGLLFNLLSLGQNEDWLATYCAGHTLLHNKAVLDLYGQAPSGRSIDVLFKQALAKAPSPELKAYTAWHYSIFLQDQGDFQEAFHLIQPYIRSEKMPEEARKALEFEQIRCQKALQESEWEKNELIAFKAMVWDVYTYYRDLHMTHYEAQLCQEMAEVAQYEENYSESLSYITKCIHIYLAEQMPEMEASAQMFKGALLHQWAKAGSPQFYQQAIKSFQRALHVFKKDEAPHLFAHIHHQLGVLYAEMPEDGQKRSIWAAVSATSFKEALEFYKPGNMPYDYAMVCHNYATALMKYPDAVRSDNVAKAIDLYEQALKIRTDQMPHERCVTLLNYLEACWEAENVNEHMEKARVKDMLDKALEALSLAPNDELKARAKEHLQSINRIVEEVTTDA